MKAIIFFIKKGKERIKEFDYNEKKSDGEPKKK